MVLAALLLCFVCCRGSWGFHGLVYPRNVGPSRSSVPPAYRHQRRLGEIRIGSSLLWSSQESSPLDASSSNKKNETLPLFSQLIASLGDGNNGGSSQPDADTSSSAVNITTPVSPEQEKLLAEAEELRQRARKLKAEALAEEAALKDTRSNQQSARIRDGDFLMHRLFQDMESAAEANNKNNDQANNNGTTSISMLEEEQKIANILREERWSPDQVLLVLERLVEQQIQHQDSRPILTPSQSAVISNNPNFQIGDTRNAAIVANETKWQVLEGWIACLINAAAMLDDEFNDKNSNNNKDNSNKSQQSSSSGEKEERAKTTQAYNSRWTGRVATTLRSRRKELMRAQEEELKRRIAANVNAVFRATSKSLSEAAAAARSPTGATPVPDDIQEYTRQTLGLPPPSSGGGGGPSLNTTAVMESVQPVPLWVPSSLLPYLVQSKATLVKEDVTTIKERVLIGSRFFCTSSDAIPSAAVFRGNIRTPVGLVDSDASDGTSSSNVVSNHTAVVFQEVQQRLETEGLAGRVQLFMMEDSEWRPGKDARVSKPNPVILAISKRVEPVESAMEKVTTSKIAKRIAVALSMLATFSFSVSSYALNPTFFDAVVNQKSVPALLSCIPLCIGILSVQLFHEAAHYLVAKLRKIKIGRPTLLPSPQVGTFGCITPILSFPTNRSALFDLAFSGPVSGMLISFLMMWGGMYATTHASEVAMSSFPVLPIGLLKSSLLTTIFVSVTAPKLVMLPMAQPIPLHPLFISGFCGLVSSALNLLPVFRLDGGRLISSLFGPRFAGVSSAATLMFMLSLTISGTSGIALTWGLLIVFLQRRTEVPVRDDVTMVDDVRFGAWIAATTAAILTLAPFPGGPGFL
ncbi:Probable zinc metalloprotease EGY1, chloroplastic [Seminavis robusta]|uniref:Probable zinc metalloprotease EGY1, chloroplastic n=1 Tax=Seminavis robusta TaxID=568900 RepID=A0A9N8HJV5_9STRA|nr:Probable zinc metalloprotease EGY1, chloroplastic [Seminavis robusta]|eukprot:Sro889_g216650.1 Probable zinc metalloprotease EGY1, chloroplastic (862) ;mRNA; r:39604-42325